MEIDPHLPVDKTAALVVARSKDHGTDFSCGAKITSMVPLPTIAWPYARHDDLTGRKCGSFTVIGYALWKPKSHQPNNVRWVVRCKCGRYQMLTTKAVKKNHPQTSCVECQRVTNKSRKINILHVSFIIIISVVALTASAQTVTIPSWVADSLIYEIKLGRSCDSLNILNERIIESQGTQLLNYDKLVKTMDSKVSTLEALVENRKEATEKLTQQFNQDRKALRKKVRIRNLIIGGQFILILIILL